jgi:hypothetical protein
VRFLFHYGLAYTNNKYISIEDTTLKENVAKKSVLLDKEEKKVDCEDNDMTKRRKHL